MLGLVDYSSSEDEGNGKEDVSSQKQVFAVEVSTDQEPAKPILEISGPPLKSTTKREMLVTDTEFTSKILKTEDDFIKHGYNVETDTRLLFANYTKLVEQYSLNQRGSNYPVEFTDPEYYKKLHPIPSEHAAETVATTTSMADESNPTKQVSRKSRWG